MDCTVYSIPFVNLYALLQVIPYTIILSNNFHVLYCIAELCKPSALKDMCTYLVQKYIQTKVCRDGRMQRCKRRCRGGGGGTTHCKNRYWCGGIAAFSSVGVVAQPEAEIH